MRNERGLLSDPTLGRYWTVDPNLTKFQGDLAEIVVFRKALTAEEDREVLRYLQRKWKLNS